MLTVTLVLTALLLGPFAATANAAEAEPDLEAGFTQTVRPFLETYCVACHSGPQPMAQFDLSRFTNAALVAEDHPHWALVIEKLSAQQMPPQAATQPPAEVRQQVIEWVDLLLKTEARRNAGDPGVVLARRLSNAEYNYTIRDLTGVDIQPTREFPVDPANPAGFDNSGESLAMSPSLVSKYLQAAREVADHMVLKPDGIAFAPHLMLVETDRDKYCVNQIIDFYNRQATDYSDYFQAAWRFKHRSLLGRPDATLARVAVESKISAKYLAAIWRTLEGSREEVGPIAKLQTMWRELPAPRGNQRELVREHTNAMREFVVQLRKKIEARFPDLSVKGVRRTSQPFLMWRNRQYATHRMDYNRDALQIDGKPGRVPDAKQAEDDSSEGEGTAAAAGAVQPDPDLFVPAAERERYEAAFARFAAVFPDAFYIAERGRDYFNAGTDVGRFLSAGFHNLMGYFRDDIPLYELILDEDGQRELDRLWRELDFVADGAGRTFTQFYLNESGEARGTSRESEGERPEGLEITSEPVIRQVEQAYLDRAAPSGNEIAIQAIRDHFESVNETIRWSERARVEAEPLHLEALLKFAARAFRRPLTPDERDGLLAFYRTMREQDGLEHEQAMRDLVVNVLMSPDFCYRIDLLEDDGGPATAGASQAQRTLAAQNARDAEQRGQSGDAAGTARIPAQPLPSYALASRLSYFLWSSMPDDELLAIAATGDLRKPEVLAAQARRMLQDKRARGLAVEFGGNWLDFRRFEEINTVDRERFPSFSDELRQAMFEEPVEFLADVIRNDRSVLDLLYAKHTFVNGVLAKHYGVPGVDPNSKEWVRLEDARGHGRGGLLPMAAFLTQNAPGLRTSPVKRGYWVVRRVLGEMIPPPPAVVPELPRDEAKMDLPLREALARHREDAGCASCHSRFDSFGLALEGYGPIGEKRTEDLAGRPVDARAQFPGGAEGTGLEALYDYIREHRENDFRENLCRKMLVYALGRSLMLSDEPLIEEMLPSAAANGDRFSSLVERIVTSPQFMRKRAPELVARKGE